MATDANTRQLLIQQYKTGIRPQAADANQSNAETARLARQNTAAAPPKANAAPSVNKNLQAGLMDALNKTEAELIKEGVWEVANRYSVEFVPAALGDARVTKGGKPNKAKTPMQQSNKPADKVDPASNSAAYDVRTIDIIAGTPIVTVINEILKNSTYVADQAKYINDEVTNEVKPQKPLGDLVWYKISVQTTPILPFDKKRNDYAYDIKYIISAYPINSMQSEYFPAGKLRGRHKSYKYWFTGQNTQVLRYEQKFNKLYHTTFTNPKILTDTRIENNRESPPREYQAGVASSSNQGAEGQANAVGASAADYLYSKTDIANAQLTIVGDPAWLQQGEVATGVSSLNYNFNPFNADGGINYDAQEIIFDVQWNPGVDYDLTGTGLANPNVGGQPQAIYTYKASRVVSKFSKGKFEQDIEGVFIDLLDATTATTATAAAAPERAAPAAAPDTGRIRQAAIQDPVAFNNTGGGAAVGNPIIARGTQLGNPNIRPGSLRERAAQANAARAAQTNANAANTTTTAPTQKIVQD
jgi:hypothetical protein